MFIDNHTHAQTKKEIKKLLSSMDKNKIDKAIILHLFENSLKELIENTDDENRLFVIGSISIENKDFYDDFIELNEVIINKKIIGVKLYLGYEHFYANDKRCDIIYQMCEKNDIPVIFHTGDTWEGTRNKSLIKYANPIFIDEVAIKYPNLKIVISHMGNPIWLNETAELVFKNENVYTDFSGMFSTIEEKDTKDIKIRKRNYNKKTEENIINLLNYIGDSRKIMFGSDFDYLSQDKHKEFIDKLLAEKYISNDEYENITHINAETVYKIK